MDKAQMINWLDQHTPEFTAISDAIWERPELGYHEFFATKLQSEFMEAQGFSITRDIAGMNTAFVAEWGKGKPVFGFAGEFDALPGLSQKPQPTPDPVEDGAPGHGCGHNLLGVGCMAAAVAVKEWLQSTGTPGTVRYYACPAEEGGAGKTFMARDGLFDDLDLAFNYHPMVFNTANKSSCLGVNHIRFVFHGKTAHAGAAPWEGRSALDAVELMNVGVNYLREHVPQDVRLHYVITNGGKAPNIVPDEAEVWYYIRAHEPKTLADVTERVRNIARGAALMTSTKMEEIFESATSSTLPNAYLADLHVAEMQKLGPTTYTKAELDYAATINQALDYDYNNLRKRFEGMNLSMEVKEKFLSFVGLPVIGEPIPSYNEGEISGGSTDVGDLSRVVPCCEMTTACWAVGVPGHSWGVTATGKHTIGHKGMMYAAKTMASVAVECYQHPEHIEKAWEEFHKRQPEGYQCPIPEGIVPPRYEE
ncbi:MAG: amidohydrolase [Anaerolineae bacterium]|jgi:aminobenzoyl-glutamate utilization protein B|nr:amidohydrolase [Anaerolineae bacterium]